MTTDAAEGGRYFAADAEADEELARLKLLEAVCDPWTFRHLDGIGIRQGWRCLEVGAGAGSVVRWLSDRLGVAGRVVAADLDPRFLGDLRAPNVEVRRCDITQDDIEPASYDLVHCRALLAHMNDPADVLRRMVAALRPGGWLVAEEADYCTVESLDPAHPLAEAFHSCFRARIEFLSATNVMDLRYGRVLPLHMESLGLIEPDIARRHNSQRVKHVRRLQPRRFPRRRDTRLERYRHRAVGGQSLRMRRNGRFRSRHHP